YSAYAHCAIIVLHCVASCRPFNSVTDTYFNLQEVELLHPGMKVPSPSTVSRDVQTIYQVGSKSIKEYFTV
ncbi:hypothetical protein BKA93DRAFT_708176, partial [Sparassis latifolia]